MCYSYSSSIISPPKQKSIMIRNFASGLMNENVLHLHLLMTRLSLPFNGGNFVLLSSIEFQFRYRRTDKIGPRRTLLKKDVSFRPHSEHLRGLVKQLSSSRGVLSCTLNTNIIRLIYYSKSVWFSWFQ